MMDEFLFRTTGSISDIDKKWESSRDEGGRSGDILDVKLEHGLVLEQTQISSQIQSTNPYNFPSHLLVDFNIHNDERYITYVETLRPNQRKRYNELIQQRDEYIMTKKKKAFPRHKMTYAQYQEKLRMFIYLLLNLFGYTHIRISEERLS